MSIVLNLRSLLLTCTVLLFTVCVGGAQEVKRPTADSDDSTVGCSGTFMATPANSLGAMYDIAGTSTSASLTAFGVNGALGSQKKAHVLTNWQPPTTVYSSLVLKVSSSCWVYGLGGTCGVYYSTTGGAPWTVIRSSGAAWSSVTDTIALSPGQSLSTLRVGICASGKNTKTDADPGAGSVTVSDVWTEGSTPPPSAPSSLIGAAAPTATSVSLGWSDTSNNELGFKIERCQAAGCSNFAWRKDAPANATAADDSTSVCTTYRYRVYAFNNAGNSGYSNVIEVATPCGPTSPPSDLIAVNPSDGGVALTWSVGTGQTSYSIERCEGEDCTNLGQVFTVDGNISSVTDNSAPYGKHLRYAVRGFNAVGYSGYSNVAEVTTVNGSYSFGTAFTTKYQYDPLGNLTCVEQHGSASSAQFDCNDAQQRHGGEWRVRRFRYNSLSLLTRAENPESSVIDYGYDADGNMTLKTSPAPNQLGTATQSIKFCYDELHRLKGKYYASTGDCQSGFAVAYSYDVGTNGIGRRTGMSDPSGSTAWTYDEAGRIEKEERTIAGVPRTIEYEYNEDDSVEFVKYPYSGTTPNRIVTYGYDSAGRATSVSDGATTFVSAATYAPHGALATARLGSSAYLANCYNTRLQVDAIVGSTADPTSACALQSSDFMHLSYSYGTLNNGNVEQIANLVDANRSQSFSYDGLNRLRTAQSTGPEWGNSYIYDAWGNLTNMEPVAGKTYSWPLNKGSAPNNQLTGDLHDAAGNLWNNGQYVWDQENRLSASAGVTYTYDGDGRRVGKSTGKLYWTGTGSDALLETAADGSIQSEYIFFNGKRVARIDSGGNVFYYFADHLGTSRIIATANGTVCYDADYYPYGKEQHVYVPNCPQEYKFTGKPRDDETGLDYFGARYYGSNVGRFLSADWSATPEPVPYADLSNPQSLNLYSYVGNNPLARFDADGHKGVVDDPQHRQQVQGDLRKLAPGTRVDSAGNVRNGNLFRRAFNHLTGHGAGQKLATNMIKSSTTFHIGVAGAQGGGTRGNSSDVYVSYSASGGSAETRTSSSATSQIASALAPASIVLGHELIHGTHIADGTISGASATHTFTEGTTTYSETYREEEFRTVGFSGFVQKGDVTENQLRHEQGLNDRAAYTPRSHWTQQTP